MKMKSVSDAKDVTLEGIQVFVTTSDGSVRRVAFKDSKGFIVEITGDYSLRILVPAPPEMKKIFSLRGEVCGIKVSEAFDDEYSAEKRREELKAKQDITDSGFIIEQTEIQIA